MRDAVLSKVPAVLVSGMYAVAPLIGGALTVLFVRFDVHGPVAMFGAAGVCFAVRMLALKFDLALPLSRHRQPDPPPRVPSPLDDMPTVRLPVVRLKNTIPQSIPREPWMDAPTVRRPRSTR